MENQLSKTEKLEFKTCEKIIEKTKGSFAECGKALTLIRDNKYYKEFYDTFEEYCEQRWGWGKSRAYQLIEAAETVSELSIKNESLSTLVVNENVARSLSKVPKEKRVKVLKAAVKDGKVTGRSVSEAAQEKIVDLDHTGYAIPSEILEQWKKAAEVQSLLSKISDVRSVVKKAKEEEDLNWVEIGQSVQCDLNNAYTSLKNVRPFAVCTTCQGRNSKGCQLCSGRGFISEFRFKQCVPLEIKAMRKKQ